MSPARTDVHAHFVPDFYRDALLDAGHERPDGGRGVPDWTAGTALEAMRRLDVQKAYLSISSPGVHFGDDRRARDLARRCNDEAARLKSEHPDRFGFFACLPLPDVDAAEAEAARALDDLGADGVVLQSNHRGLYPADPRLAELWAQLDQRRAVVFLHPTSPACGAVELALGYPRSMLEFMFETTRAVTQLVLSGRCDAHPQVRLLLPHAGAVLPVLASRIELFQRMGGSEPRVDVRAGLRRMHYDLAGAPLDELLVALLAVADPGHLHYGSDYPYTPLGECLDLAAALDRGLAPVRGDDGLAVNSRALFGPSADPF